MIDLDIPFDKVIAPKHYGPIFKQYTIGCDYFVSYLPFWLGMAFKYIWRAGRKEGADIKLDINKASECMRKWTISHNIWYTGEDIYKGASELQNLFKTVFTLEADDPKEQWRLDALYCVLHGDEQHVDNYLGEKLDELDKRSS